MKSDVFSGKIKIYLKWRVSMKIRGEKYSFIGTAIAILVILLFLFLNRFVFSEKEPDKEDTILPTESTLAISLVPAEIIAPIAE